MSAEDFAIVREALASHSWGWKDLNDHVAQSEHSPDCRRCASDAALARIVARLADANLMLDECRDVNRDYAGRLEDALHRLAEVEKERDEYMGQWADVTSMEFLDYWQSQKSMSAGTAIKQLLARVVELEEALRAIADMRGTPEARTGRWHEVARRALNNNKEDK